MIERNLFVAFVVSVASLPAQSAREWPQHSPERPMAPIEVPPVQRLPVAPPPGATVLFDGRDFAQWERADGSPVRWRLTGDGAMEIVARTGGIRTRFAFGDILLHVEWATPSPAKGEGQARGNSGVFLMERYEVQVLDSFKNQTYPDGQAAALYGQFPPLVNASRGPGVWQSFDIVFIAPRFANGTLTSPARVTVFHNNVLVHHDVTLIGQTAHQVVGVYAPHADRLPIKLQDHGNLVKFRNIWARRLGS